MADYDVELRGVLKRFGAATAVDCVTLAVRRGEFFSLLGPSGCGKTTTLRLIAGFEEPDEGEVYISGEPMTGRPAYQRNVNTVFQAYALFPHMDVFENVAFGLRRKGFPDPRVRERVGEALQMVRLHGLERRRPHQLSGGQQQRVALARALVNRPAVLLLDEPLGALDLKLRKQMQIELKRLQRGVEITFIYVTHDQEEALTMSDRIGVMNGGHIEQVGSPAEIYERPASRFVADFIGVANFLSGTVVSSTPEWIVVDVAGGRIHLPRVSDLSVGEVAELSVRPEKLWLSTQALPDAAARANSLPGRIEEVIYLGVLTQYTVKAEAGTLTVMQQNLDARAAPRLGPGDHVVVHWAPENTMLLPEHKGG